MPSGSIRYEEDEEVSGMIGDLLASPVLKRVLCNPTDQISFRPGSRIVARLNRAELGDFDALVLGLFLMARFQGQLIVSDFGCYGRDSHVSYIRENRLIAGVNFLNELSPKLRRAVLLMYEKRASGTIMEDAETLAQYARLVPGTTGRARWPSLSHETLCAAESKGVDGKRNSGLT